ncbi:MAG TPA: shikimate kinase [Candidatus Saccharimonadales bacterium]|jgi:shikimate kinase|nr:shikimate kinase [Candidatus Saccharimonadales bacterium]
MRAAEAVSHGAVTIVNAMATGKGAAIGIDLWTKAKVTLTDKPGKIVCRNFTETNDDHLMRVTVTKVLRKFKLLKRHGAIVETQSNIPVAVGLKSSSAASNAVTRATLEAIGEELDDYQTVRLGVDASLDAGVTITGAFDDACACYFGGVMVTNNLTRQVLKRFKPPRGFSVLLYVPTTKKYTKDVNLSRLTKIKPLIETAFQETLNGNHWFALTLNGFTYAEAFGYNTDPIKDALFSGAIASGLTGKGPAIVAIVHESNFRQVQKVWSCLSGKIIRTSFNLEKATSVKVDQ